MHTVFSGCRPVNYLSLSLYTYKWKNRITIKMTNKLNVSNESIYQNFACNEEEV